MGRVRYTPNRVLQEVVLATKLLRETWFGSDGQSQIHTQPYLEGSCGDETLVRGLVRFGWAESDTHTPNRVLKEVVLARKPLGEIGIGWAESDTHPTVS